MKGFKTESKRMLDLMINSIYTNREIFLRELLSNASDAIDKLYYKSLTEGLSGLTRSDFQITLEADKDARTLKISDNGIGMTAEELENNLGTIAKSGSLEFKSTEKDEEAKKDIDVIGQFGVGFYSAFMVAKRVEVRSKTFGAEKAYLWMSEGAEGYDVTETEKETVGTEITLYLKDDTEEEKYGEFVSEYKIRDLVKKYSDYIRYPIKMEVTTYEYPTEEESAEGEDKEKKEPKEVKKIETLNSMTPLWKKQKSEVKEGEYEEFYKETYYDGKAPLRVITTSAEGTVEYKALLFIPETIPYNYYNKSYEKGLALYTSGVMITEKCAELLPDYFNFVKGVVDSELTLNISRETVQQNRQLKVIAANLEKKIKNELLSMITDDREKYEIFFKNFGASLKYGVYSSFGAKNDLLSELLMFYSAKTGKYVTLNEYISGMIEGQEKIYYATGKSVDGIKALPRTDALMEKGYDVLCLTEEIDEFCVKMLRAFDEREFCSVENADEAFAGETAAIDETLKEKIQKELEGKVAEVKGSASLKNHPVCLSSKGELSIEMEKVLAAMPGGEGAKAQKTLEINVNHPVYEKLKASVDDEERFKKLVYCLFEQAKLIAGLEVEDPTKLTDTLFELIG